MRLVLDTNVVVSALLWHGTPHRLIAAAREQSVTVFTSPILLAELEDVLSRQKLQAAIAASKLTPSELAHHYRRLAMVIQPLPISPVILADPDDDHVLACALTARADAIVSGDSDLLGLREYEGLPILSAADCLTRLST